MAREVICRPRGHLEVSGDIFGCLKGKVLLVFNGWRPRMPLNYLAPTVNRTEAGREHVEKGRSPREKTRSRESEKLTFTLKC